MKNAGCSLYLYEERGDVFFLFRRKKEPKKSLIGLFSRKCSLVQAFRVIYGSYITFLRRLTRPEPVGACFILICGSRSYNLHSFRDSANDPFFVYTR